MMRGLIVPLVLCTIASIQVESSVVTIDSLISLNTLLTVDVVNEMFDEEFDFANVREYSFSFNSSDDDSDIPLLYVYYDENKNIVDYGETSLCSADLSDSAGTVAAIVAMALGIKSSPVCPRNESTLSQKSVFRMDGGDFSTLPQTATDDDIISVKLDVYGAKDFKIQLSVTEESDWFADENAQDPDENPDQDSQNEEGQQEEENSAENSE